MTLDTLKTELNKRYVDLKEVANYEELEENQDTVLIKNKNIVGLHLKNVDLEGLFQKLFQISSLKYLFLKNVNLQEDSFEGNRLERLEVLDLSYNYLKEIPKEVFNLIYLRSLNLRNNALDEIVEELFNLTSLKSLDFSSNSLKKIPKKINNLINLQNLYLNSNNIQELPKEIINLKNLLSLDLSSNKLKETPKEIFNLINLKSLHLSDNTLKELPKEIENLTGLQSLYLSYNGLENIPKEILELTSLQSLNLRNNSLEELPKEIENLTNLQNLNLRNNVLHEIVKEIENLTSLRNLNLRSNSLQEVPKELLNLTNLQSLYLSSNSIQEVPEEIKNLINLKSLDLSSNKLKKTPKEIFNLISLQSLNLSDNSLQELPKEIDNLTSLQSLYLSYNGFENIPKEILKLTSLKTLYLRDNSLKTIPKEILSLTSLQSLNLRNNRLYEIPKEIENLTNLQSLDLSANRLSKIDKETFNLITLRSLNLKNNSLKEIPKEIKNLINLQSLDLSYNNLQHISKEIFYLTSLQGLNLSSNSLEKFPKEVFNLKRLTYLKLSDYKSKYNPIRTIPEELLGLKVLRSFFLNKNYLDSFYKSAYEGGLQNLKNAIKQKIEQGSGKLYEAKLLFVGEPKSGKTSLMEKILDKGYELKDPESSESTLGVDIKDYSFPFIQNKEINFKTNMWDFGGQQIQYMTHQFFLTPNSLYVLVGDDRKDNSSFDYWFHIISLLSEKSPVLVVLNEINHKHISNFDLMGFEKQYPEHKIVKEDVDLSNMNDGRYEVIREKIKAMLSSLPHVGMELPSNWIEIRKKLEEIAKEKNYISFTEFTEICEGYGLEGLDIETLSKHFHNLGIFLHFIEDRTGLADTIFLNPKWVMDGIYSVLADKKIEKDRGRFTRKWLFKFWDDQGKGYNLTIKNNLLSLMLKDKFEICYELEGNRDTFIAPQLLPATLENGFQWGYENSLTFRFEYYFMPKGIISRLIVRLHDLIFSSRGEEFVWEKGVILKSGDVKALVIEKESKGRKVIDITLSGEKHDSQVLLSKIKFELENIHKRSFQNIQYEEMIPCCCEECEEEEESHYFPFSKLQRYIRKNKSTVECDISTDDVNIADLLGNVTVKNEKSIYSEELERVSRGGNTFNIHIDNSKTYNISTLGRDLNSLKRALENSDDKSELKELIEDFEKLPKDATKQDLEDKGLYGDIKEFASKNYNRLEKASGLTDKMVKVRELSSNILNNLDSLGVF